MSISACGTVILHIHTPYVVSKGISGDRGGVFAENSYVGEKSPGVRGDPKVMRGFDIRSSAKASPKIVNVPARERF